MTVYTVRNALPADAAAYIALIRAVLMEHPPADTPYLSSEFDPPEERIAERILDVRLSDNSLFIVAEADDVVVGALTCAGGTLAADRHTTSLGMYVAKEWRNQGVGSGLMAYAIQWAAQSPMVERMELEVYASNERAIHLYEKFGFEHEGRKRRMFYHHGQVIDNLIMASLFTPRIR